MVDYDQLAAEYSRHRQDHPLVVQNLLSTPVLSSSSKVLEIVCGTGNYLTALHKATGCECWGIDPSKQMLAEAKKHPSSVNFELGEVERLIFEKAAFDLVFSVDVIHHVTDRPAYFREAHRVLRDGVRICTATDSGWIIRHRAPLAVYFPETVDVDLDRYRAIAELREAMNDCGFGEIGENLVEFAYRQSDVQAYRDKTFSVLHLIPDEAYLRGIKQMEQDLRAGSIHGVSRYLLLWGTK